MSRRLDGRIGRLEEQQTDDVDHERIARGRAKQERIRELAKEDPEGLKTLLDAEDEELEAIEEARVRCRATGEDPRDAPEVWEAHQAVERIERRLLGENEDDEGRRRH